MCGVGFGVGVGHVHTCDSPFSSVTCGTHRVDIESRLLVHVNDPIVAPRAAAVERAPVQRARLELAAVRALVVARHHDFEHLGPRPLGQTHRVVAHHLHLPPTARSLQNTRAPSPHLTPPTSPAGAQVPSRRQGQGRDATGLPVRLKQLRRPGGRTGRGGYRRRPAPDAASRLSIVGTTVRMPSVRLPFPTMRGSGTRPRKARRRHGSTRRGDARSARHVEGDRRQRRRRRRGRRDGLAGHLADHGGRAAVGR